MRLPENLPVDTFGQASLRSFAPARASLLRDIGARQHSVMSKFGGAPQIFSTYLNGTAPTTFVLPTLRVPPGTTRAIVGVLMRGRGTVKVYTSADTGGISFRGTSGPSSEQITWAWGSGSDGATAGVSRTLIIASTSAETWGTVTATLATEFIEIFAVAIIPQHLAR
jgi:hypothetical protein